jgi:hypothetical protein
LREHLLKPIGDGCEIGYCGRVRVLAALGEDRLCLLEGALVDQRLVCGEEVLVAPADAS